MRRPAAAEPMPAWAQWRFAPSDDRMTVPDTPSKTPAIGLGSVFLRLRAKQNWCRLFHELIADFSTEAVAARQAGALAEAGVPSGK